MKYLGYYEVIEGSGFEWFDTLDDAKYPWCFNMRIFETGDLTKEEFDRMELPRFPKVEKRCKLAYSDNNKLMHATSKYPEK